MLAVVIFPPKLKWINSMHFVRSTHSHIEYIKFSLYRVFVVGCLYNSFFFCRCCYVVCFAPRLSLYPGNKTDNSLLCFFFFIIILFIQPFSFSPCTWVCVCVCARSLMNQPHIYVCHAGAQIDSTAFVSIWKMGKSRARASLCVCVWANCVCMCVCVVCNTHTEHIYGTNAFILQKDILNWMREFSSHVLFGWHIIFFPVHVFVCSSVSVCVYVCLFPVGFFHTAFLSHHGSLHILSSDPADLCIFIMLLISSLLRPKNT